MKNTLIQYRGGGYDGCFWEWNFCYYDHEEKFHDIFSSGCNGCKTMGEMIEYIGRVTENINEYYEYDLDNKKDVREFTEKTNEGAVIGVAKWLYKNIGISIEGKCDICGKKFDLSDGYAEGYEECGGIAIQATMKVCEECYYMHCCTGCGEFYEKPEFNEEGLCECCVEYEKERRKEELIKNVKNNLEFGNVVAIESLGELRKMEA